MVCHIITVRCRKNEQHGQYIDSGKNDLPVSCNAWSDYVLSVIYLLIVDPEHVVLYEKKRLIAVAIGT